MNKKQLIFIWTALFCLISGCTTLNKSHQNTIKKIMKKELAWFYKIKPIDLDKDGEKEAVVIYAFGTHHSGVKVIKFSGEKTDILFEDTSATPNIEFKIYKGTPIIIVEESEYAPDYASSRRYKKIYQWDGKTFKIKNSFCIFYLPNIQSVTYKRIGTPHRRVFLFVLGSIADTLFRKVQAL